MFHYIIFAFLSLMAKIPQTLAAATLDSVLATINATVHRSSAM